MSTPDTHGYALDEEGPDTHLCDGPSCDHPHHDEARAVARIRELLTRTAAMLHDVIEGESSGVPTWQIEELASDIDDVLLGGAA